MVEKSDFNSNGKSDDYHTATTVEELTQTNIDTILQLEAAAKKINLQPSGLPK